MKLTVKQDNTTTETSQANLLHPPFPLIEKQLDSLFMEYLDEIVSEFLPEYELLESCGIFHDGAGSFIFPDAQVHDCTNSMYMRIEILIADSLGISPQRSRELSLAFIAEKFKDEDAAELLSYFNQIIRARKFAAHYDLPVASVYKKTTHNGREYVLVKCPFCGSLHTHGNRPFTLRTTHCRDQEQKYIIGELYHG